METGHLVYQIHEPHGPGHEVTAVNVNTSGYRLVTGAYDGIVISLAFIKLGRMSTYLIG